MSGFDWEKYLSDGISAARKSREDSAFNERLDRLEQKLDSLDLSAAAEAAVEARIEKEREKREEETAPPAADKPPAEPPAVEDEKPKRVRPGRKAGQAYGWTTDEGGKVIKLDTARVYSGPDEPAEVELPDEEASA